MLGNIFEKLELGEVEARVYLTLLEFGASPAANLAKKLQVPRSSLYGFLSRLTSLGLVNQSELDGVRLWRAEPPEKISALLDGKLNAFETLKNQFDTILPILQSRQATDFVVPRFYYFEGVEGVRNILEDVLLYRDIETECFWPARDMMEILGDDFMSRHNVRRIRQGVSIRSIWPSTRTVDIEKRTFLGVGPEFLREIRIPPEGIDCSMGYWAYHNKVGFVSSRKESFGFIVESMELRQLLKTQFEVLWGMSSTLKADKRITAEFLEQI